MRTTSLFFASALVTLLCACNGAAPAGPLADTDNRDRTDTVATLTPAELIAHQKVDSLADTLQADTAVENENQLTTQEYE